MCDRIVKKYIIIGCLLLFTLLGQKIPPPAEIDTSDSQQPYGVTSLNDDFICYDMHISPPYMLADRDSPMLIESDNDFLFYEIPGSGTAEDPYRIEHLLFTSAVTGDYALKIQYTTKYFIIQHCYFDSPLAASGEVISVHNIEPNTARILNNTIVSAANVAISLYESDGTEVSNNVVTNVNKAIVGQFSKDVTITNNHLTGGSESVAGIMLSNTQMSSVINNTGEGFNRIIYGIDSNTLSIVNNTCIGAREYAGIYFLRVEYSLIINNMIFDSFPSYILDNADPFDTYTGGWGIFFLTSSNNKICYNTIQNCENEAILLNPYLPTSGDLPINNTIHHNYFLDNNYYGNERWSDKQAYDVSTRNTWYEPETQEGNYWSDLGNNTEYVIGGDANQRDIYPLNDKDADGTPDWWEETYGFDPLTNDSDQDPDEDLLTNLEEYTHKTNPLLNDTDSDTLLDGWEVANGLNPTSDDTDSDDMPDGYEVTYGLDPLYNDTTKDLDEDGLSNIDEYILGTNPSLHDTDGDGETDGFEVEKGFDPLDPKSSYTRYLLGRILPFVYGIGGTMTLTWIVVLIVRNYQEIRIFFSTIKRKKRKKHFDQQMIDDLSNYTEWLNEQLSEE